MNKRGRYFKSSRLIIFSLVIINLIIIMASYRYFLGEKRAFTAQKVDQLTGIADMKVNQIVDWRNERFSDARYLSVNQQVNENFLLLLNNHDNDNYRQMLFSNLIGMFLNGKYESMVALDSSGHRFFSIPEQDSAIHPYLHHAKMRLIRNSAQIENSDLFISDSNLPIMQLTIPIYKVIAHDTVTFGWLLLNINLKKDFFPLFETLPIPSKTMEAMLVYRENNKILQLNRTVYTSLTKRALPPDKVTTALKGEALGLDFLGEEVLAASLPVPGSKTYLFIKIEKSEAFAEVRKMRNSTIVFAILMIVAFTSSISFFWVRQRSELMTLESEKKMIQERFDMLTKFANDAIIVYTLDLTILQVNDKALDLYGYTREEFLGMGAELLRSPELRSELPMLLETTIREGGYRFDTIHMRKDGTTFPVEVSLRYMEMMGSHCFQSLVRDITQRKQFEKALIASEERLRLITNTMPQIVWTANPDGSFDFVNSRFEVLTGLHPLKENSIAGFVHIDDQKRVIRFWYQAVHKIEEHQIRLRLRMNNGTYRWFLCIAIPLCGEDGKVIKWYGSATDIDELENTVAQRTAELSDLYNNAPCGYHSLDINGRFIKINDTALSWLGYKREDIIGRKSFADLITEGSQKAFVKNFNIFKNKGYVNNLEYDMVRKDGSVLPVLLSATAVKDINDNIIMTRTTIIDHTERKRHENEILKLNAILQEHGYNLEYANKELEAFIFSVSHDLRAPLRAINGFSGILLEEYSDKLDLEGRQLLEKVWVNANRMRQLIDDLLRLSRTGRQELSYARIDMLALFNSMIEETRQQFPERKVDFTVNQLPVAYGDLALLKQVISNLLSNAVKFSSKNDVSQIEIGSIDKETEPTFYIKDNGTGFDMRFVHELFGVFRRLNNADEYEGTGVGLALVKRIIDKHGGRVWAYSEPGRGATFYFSLPRNEVA